jgi:hypothetical protein
MGYEAFKDNAIIVVLGASGDLAKKKTVSRLLPDSMTSLKIKANQNCTFYFLIVSGFIRTISKWIITKTD